MRALSIRQPWASLIVGWAGAPGPKGIENRSDHPAFAAQARGLVGTTIAIHAAATIDQRAVAEQLRREHGCPESEALPRRAVIGTARIAGVELLHMLGALGRLPADQEQWAFGPLCLLLTDRVALAAPVPCRGMLGFWTLTAAVEIAVRNQGGGGR